LLFFYIIIINLLIMEREQLIFQLRHVWQFSLGTMHKLKAGLYLFPALGEATVKSSTTIPTSNNSYYTETIDTKVETGWLSFSGVFLQDEMTLVEDFFYINPSVNVQYFTPNSQWLVNPRFTCKLKPLPDWEVSFATGIFSQYPINARLIDDELGNPKLMAEEAVHYVLGTMVNIQEDLFIQLDAYYKDYWNLIISDPDPDLNYTNHSRGYAYGIDVMIKKELGGNWDGWLTYSWVTSRRGIDERTDPTVLGMLEDNTPLYTWYIPTSEIPNALNLVLNYNFTDEWKLALTQKFFSGKIYTPITGGAYQDAIDEYVPNLRSIQ